jgi:predicted ester cyclase
MGKNLDTFNAFSEAANSDSSSLEEVLEKFLSDDFQNLDMDGNVQMDRETYIRFFKRLQDSFPDFTMEVNDAREEGDSVILRYRFAGTFTNDLDFSAAGLGLFPASGKKIIWPEATVDFKFAGDKIASIQVADEAAGGDVFLSSLGVSPIGA